MCQFLNVPIPNTVNIIKKKLFQSWEFNPLEIHIIIKLLHFIDETNHFQFGNKIYTEIWDAHGVTCQLDKCKNHYAANKVSSQYPHSNPNFYVRYVDDILTECSHDEQMLTTFKEKLKQPYDAIKFVVEKENISGLFRYWYEQKFSNRL